MLQYTIVYYSTSYSSIVECGVRLYEALRSPFWPPAGAGWIIHIYIYTHINIVYIYIYIYTYIHIRVDICIYIYIYSDMYVYIYIYTYELLGREILYTTTSWDCECARIEVKGSMHHPLWVVVVVGVVYRIGLPSYTSQGKGRQGMGGSFRKQPPRLSTRLCPVVKCPHLCTSELASEGHSVTGAPGVPGVPGYIYIYIYIHTVMYIYIYIWY